MSTPTGAFAGPALRRALWLLVAAAPIAAGAGALHDVFSAERDDARRAVEARRQAIDALVTAEGRRVVRDTLEVARARVRTAVEDPLEDSAGLYLAEPDHGVRLPRPGPRNGPAVAVEVLADLRAGRFSSSAEGPWAERLEHVRALSEALHDGVDDAVGAAFRALLLHRTRFVLHPARDLASLVAALEAFAALHHPDPAFVRRLLRDGHDGLPGLQAALVVARGRLAAADVDALTGAIVGLSERFHAPIDRFLPAVRAQRPAPDLPTPDGPAWVGGWVVAPAPGGGAFGAVLDVEALTGRVQARVAEALPEDAQLLWTGGAAGLDRLEGSVRSGAWPAQLEAATARHRLKAALLALTCLLAFLVLALGLRAVERRRRFVEMKDDFVAAVSHELRTPLASVRLLAENLERRPDAPDRVRDYAARMIRDVDGLDGLVANILSFNRIDKGRAAPRSSEVPLTDAVSRALETLPETTRWTLEGLEGVRLEADPELLGLVLSNLFRNAHLYNTRDPVVVGVVAVADPAGLRLRVTDNGVGVPDASRARIFEPFERGGAVSARGTGLGLALCRRVMAMHGGTIQLADSGPEGSTFELFFPRGRSGTASTLPRPAVVS
jgi:signal transduction histidine kinase